MISQKISKSCGIIYRIYNTLDIKSKRHIYFSLVHPHLTYCVNIWSSTFQTNLKIVCSALFCTNCKKIKLYLHYLRLHSNRIRGIFSQIKIFSLLINWLINKKEYLPIKWSMACTYLLGDILTDRQELDHCQLKNYENLRIPFHSKTHSQLFIRYRAIKTWHLMIYVEHLPFPV